MPEPESVAPTGPGAAPKGRRRLFLFLAVLLLAVLVVLIQRLSQPVYLPPIFPEPAGETAAAVRRELFAEVQPTRLGNCELARFGEGNDGGYLLCANLLGEIAAGYSYGIDGYDQWGCDVSLKRRVTVHQYDCFDLERPSCTADTRFHEECVDGRASTDGEGRRFDTIEGQLAANGHAASRVVMKMDVEGAEWDALAAAPDAVLQRIDQLVLELHGTSDPRYVTVIRRLKQFFHVAHLHFNNFSCWPGLQPFPSWAYEVLLVNKRIGVADGGTPPALPHSLDAPNNLRAPDCQVPRSGE